MRSTGTVRCRRIIYFMCKSALLFMDVYVFTTTTKSTQKVHLAKAQAGVWIVASAEQAAGGFLVG